MSRVPPTERGRTYASSSGSTSSDLDSFPQTFKEALEFAAIAVILPEGDEEEKAPKKSQSQGQLKNELLAGDPLADLPDAEEGGAVVAFAKETPDEIDNFMNQYGIEVGVKKPWWQDMPFWVKWIRAFWNEIEGRLDPKTQEEMVKEDEESQRDLPKKGKGMTSFFASDPANGGKTKEDQSLFATWRVIKFLCVYINDTAFFKNFFGFLIVFNTIYMGIEVDNDWSTSLTDVIDNLFITLFAIEIAIRCIGNDKRLKDEPFLIFDTAIVLVSVIDTWILPFILRLETGGVDLRTVSAFRVLRIIRIARLLRLVRWLRPLRLMERSLRRGFSMFGTIMAFLLVYLYVMSLLMRMLLEGTQAQFEPWMARGWIGRGWIGPEEFDASVLTMMTYLFEAIFCGFDWLDRMVMPLVQYSWLPTRLHIAGVMLVFFMFVSKIALLNVFTASMVDNYLLTTQIDNVEMEIDDLAQNLDLHGFEQILDQASDNHNCINWEHFETFCKNHADGPKFLRLLGIDPIVTDLNTEAEIRLKMLKTFQSLDVAKESEIPNEVFKMGYVKLQGAKKTLDGLMTDYMLKEVLVRARDHHELIQPVEHQIQGIDQYVDEIVRRFEFVNLDLQDRLCPITLSLTRMQDSFDRIDQSLADPLDDAEDVPAARAAVADGMLRKEMDELRKAAQDFLNTRHEAWMHEMPDTKHEEQPPWMHEEQPQPEVEEKPATSSWWEMMATA